MPNVGISGDLAKIKDLKALSKQVATEAAKRSINAAIARVERNLAKKCAKIGKVPSQFRR